MSPEFQTPGLICRRQTQVVGVDGLAVRQETTKTFSGVVTTPGGNSLMRRAEGEHITESIVIHSRYPLMTGSVGRSADIVTWQGNNYTVTGVRDYSTYGRGYTRAECELIPLSGGV